MTAWTQLIANPAIYNKNHTKAYVMIHAPMEHISRVKFVSIAQALVKSVTVSTYVNNVNQLMYCMKTNVYLTAHQELSSA